MFTVGGRKVSGCGVHWMRHCESLKELKGFRGCRREETENVEALTEERRVRERGACSPTRERPIRLSLRAGCVLPGRRNRGRYRRFR